MKMMKKGTVHASLCLLALESVHPAALSHAAKMQRSALSAAVACVAVAAVVADVVPVAAVVVRV